MNRLVLKRARASRPSGEWKHEDFDVIADGKVVGRIYQDGSASTPPELRWFWSILEVITMPGVATNGHAPTLDEAKAKGVAHLRGIPGIAAATSAPPFFESG